MVKIVIVLLLAISCINCQSAVYKKVIIPDSKAVCLDGSPAVYYLEDAGRNPNKFVIHFQGGGWCGGWDLQSTIENCYNRSTTSFGSSNSYPASMSFGDGMMSNSARNYFSNFTKIYVKYCDGTGHQGSKASPVIYKGKNIFFRGHDITMGVLNNLQKTHGFFSKSSEIVVTGSSAGGVAAFLWINYIWQKSTTKNVYAVPDAGIFMEYKNYKTGRDELMTIFSNFFKISNVQIDPPVPQCVKANSNQPYKCMLAQYMYPHIKTKIFPVHSQYDTVTLPVIIGADCVKNRSLSTCTEQQKIHIQNYHGILKNFMNEIAKNHKNGIWAPICAEHVLTLNGVFQSQNWEVPMKSGNTADKTIKQWLENPTGNNIHIDQGVWPANQPCSGL